MPTSVSEPVLYLRHSSLPESRSRAMIQPRAQKSSPAFPTTTAFPTTSGAEPSVSPTLKSAVFQSHLTSPLAVSTAIVWPSDVLIYAAFSDRAGAGAPGPLERSEAAAGSACDEYRHFGDPTASPNALR